MPRHFPGEDERAEYILADYHYEKAREGLTFRTYEAVEPMTLSEISLDTRVVNNPLCDPVPNEEGEDETLIGKQTRVYLSYETTRNAVGIGKYRIHSASVNQTRDKTKIESVIITSTYPPPEECGMWIDITAEPTTTEAVEDE